MEKKQHHLINLLLAFLFLAAIACGGQLYSDFRENASADAAANEISNLKPTIINDSSGEDGSDTGEHMDFSGIQIENSDVVAWLTIPGTQIDYPVVQTTDNEFYLHHDAKKNANGNGALFLDYRARSDFSDFNKIIYGHHMQSGMMFQNLMKFKEKDFFDSHQTGTLYTQKGTRRLEFFAIAVVPYDSKVYDCTPFSIAEKEAYFKNVEKVAMHYRDIGISANDEIIVLSTCSYEYQDAKTVVIARLAK
jgi:sortase B